MKVDAMKKLELNAIELGAVNVPEFARLNDYVGAWAIEPSTFAGLWHLAQSIDLAVHVRAADAAKARATDAPSPALALEKTATGNGTIAIVKIAGVMMKPQSSFGGTSTIQARRDIRQAAADPDVAGILLAIDSPGGTVAGTDDLAADVRAARKSKAVWAHIEDMGASAAYWIASQAAHITANSNTALVGSIGTVSVIYDQSGAAEKQGVRTLVFATGPLKGAGWPGSKVTDEQAAHFQGIVDSMQASFDQAVQKGRGFTNAQLAAVRHGGAMTAPKALDANLIDAIQPLSKTIADFAQAIKAGQDKPKRRAQLDTGLRAGVGSLPMTARHGLPMLEQ